MTSKKWTQWFAGLAAAAAFAWVPATVQAGGGCGCEPPASTVCCMPCRPHHYRCCPPTGMVVPTAAMMPMMAAPVAAAPMMAAPMMMAAPVAAPASFVAAPAQTFSLVPVQTQSFVVQNQAAASTLTNEQFMQAFSKALNDAKANAAQNAPAQQDVNLTAEQRLSRLEERVLKLEAQTDELSSITSKIVDVLNSKKGD